MMMMTSRFSVIGCLFAVMLCTQGCAKKKIANENENDKQVEQQSRTQETPKALLDETKKVFDERKHALREKGRNIIKKAKDFKHEIKHELKDIKKDVKEGVHKVVDTVKKASKGSLAVGSMAPSFTLKDEQGNERSLEEFKGKRIVLYFYPMDDSPGCTKQACSLRDNYGLFEKNNIVVLGVSYDSVKSHKKFKEKYSLPFILLSDNKKLAAKAYGAKSAWIFVPQRKTIVIDEKGMVTDILNDVDPATHTHVIVDRLGIH